MHAGNPISRLNELSRTMITLSASIGSNDTPGDTRLSQSSAWKAGEDLRTRLVGVLELAAADRR